GRDRRGSSSSIPPCRLSARVSIRPSPRLRTRALRPPCGASCRARRFRTAPANPRVRFATLVVAKVRSWQIVKTRRIGAGEGELSSLTAPLYRVKAEFFKTLGHPARIRVLELLSEREHSVGEMLPEVAVEPANLSQHLAVLRRAGLVTTRKDGSTVFYSLTSPR